MPTTSLSRSAIDALCEKELEILRLLASGHTAKSIAVCLDRSETSINERLREARRKTGIGSSRELARLLANQKNWDKNIDLPRSRSTTESSAGPVNAARQLPKGIRIMLLSIPLAAALSLSLAVGTDAVDPPQEAALTRPSPLIGNWSLDVDRISGEEPPRSVTISFSVSTDNTWTTQVEIVGPDGSVRRAVSSAVPGNGPVAIAGNMEFIDSVSLRQPAPNTMVMTLGKNGAPVSTRVYTAAKDGQSMTETIVWAGDSVPALETTHFRRTS